MLLVQWSWDFNNTHFKSYLVLYCCVYIMALPTAHFPPSALCWHRLSLPYSKLAVVGKWCAVALKKNVYDVLRQDWRFNQLHQASSRSQLPQSLSLLGSAGRAPASHTDTSWPCGRRTPTTKPREARTFLVGQEEVLHPNEVEPVRHRAVNNHGHSLCTECDMGQTSCSPVSAHMKNYICSNKDK